MKGPAALDRWQLVLAIVLPALLAMATPAISGAAPVAAPAEDDTSSVTEATRRRRDRGPRNAILASATFPIPDYGVGLSYLRALGRRFSLSGGLEYTLPRRGYSHLVGMAETVGGQVWIMRALHGVFAEANVTVAHTSLARAPLLRRVVVAPGLAAGLRWQLDVGLVLGASGQLRFAQAVGGSELVCTRPAACPATRAGIYARIGLEVGWAF